MAIILAFAPQQAFNPEMTATMSAAFEGAWTELKDIGRVSTASFRAEETREMLAKRIIQTARTGILDPDILRHDALIYFFETRLRRQA